MGNTFSKQLWIVFKIWLIAVWANTILGAIYLTNFFTVPANIPELMWVGMWYGASWSFPVFVVLLIVLNRCVALYLTGIWIFRIVFICGIVLTFFVFVFFRAYIDPLKHAGLFYGLQFVALLAAITGIASQYRSLLTSGSEFQKKDNYKP